MASGLTWKEYSKIINSFYQYAGCTHLQSSTGPARLSHLDLMEYMVCQLKQQWNPITESKSLEYIKKFSHSNLLSDGFYEDEFVSFVCSLSNPRSGPSLETATEEENAIHPIHRKLDDIKTELETITPEFYSQRISLRIVSAHNLSRHLRLKQRKDEILISTLDPSVRISFNFTSAKLPEHSSTLILENQIDPEWNQCFDICINIPGKSPIEAYQWLAGKYLQFDLYDHFDNGLVSHFELLNSFQLPVSHLLEMFTQDNQFVLKSARGDSTLEISVFLHDFYSKPWSVIRSAFYATPVSILGLDIRNLSENQQIHECIRFCTENSFLFARKRYRLLGRSSTGEVLPLNHFLQALKLPSDIDFNLQNIAHIVSNIESDEFNSDIFNLIRNPQQVVNRQRATMLEKAILLWGILKGQCVDSYLSFGYNKFGDIVPWVTLISETFREVVENKPIAEVVESSAETGSSPIKMPTARHRRPTVNTPPSNLRPYLSPHRRLTTNIETRTKIQPIQPPQLPNTPKTPPDVTFKAFSQVHFIDLSTGKLFDPSKNSPFTDISTLINEKGTFCNMQRFSYVTNTSFEWNLKNENCWTFLDTKPNLAEVFSLNNPWCKTTIEQEQRALLKCICEFISAYRKNSLLIPSTQFHRPLCQDMQRKIDQCKNIKMLTNQVEDSLLEFGIPGYAWNYKTFEISNIPQMIFKEIERSGILDCSVPKALYFIAIRVVRNSLFPSNIALCIGYEYDIFFVRKGISALTKT